MVEIWTFRYFGVVSLKRSLGVELRIPTIKHYSNYHLHKYLATNEAW
jgi:hypothetical protein